MAIRVFIMAVTKSTTGIRSRSASFSGRDLNCARPSEFEPVLSKQISLRQLERFQEKWARFSVRKRDQTRNLERFHDSINLGNGLVGITDVIAMCLPAVAASTMRALSH